MAKFMFVYRSCSADHSSMSPEEMQQIMQAWMNWIGKGMEAGWMLDGGDGLKPEGRVIQADGSVTDGPYAESKELVGGYSMIQAANFDEAAEHAKECPIFAGGGSVEIRELAGVGSNEE